MTGYPSTLDELIESIQQGVKIVRESYYTSDHDSDSWISWDGNELDYDKSPKILELIWEAEKNGVIKFEYTSYSPVRQTELAKTTEG